MPFVQNGSFMKVAIRHEIGTAIFNLVVKFGLQNRSGIRPLSRSINIYKSNSMQILNFLTFLKILSPICSDIETE